MLKRWPVPIPYILRALCALALLVVLTAPAGADILAVETFGGRVGRVDELTGQPVPDWEILAGAVEVEPGVFPGLLSGVAVSGDVVYVTSNSTGHVLHFDLETGEPIDSGVFAKLPDNQSGVAAPGPVKIGPDGNIYVADNGGSQVHYYTPEGQYQDAVINVLQGAGGIAFRSGGSLLAAEFGTGAVYEATGEPPPQAVVSAEDTPLFGPNGVLVNEDDSFLVVDLFGDGVYSFSEDGSTFNLFADIPMPEDVDPDNPPPGAQPSPLGGLNSFPSDLLATPEGDVLVATLGVSSVIQGAPKNYGALLRYDGSGALLETLASDLTPIGAITLAPGLVTTPGDYDRDGEVTADDYAFWQDSYGRQVTALSGPDGNGDGVIDAADYTVWRDNLTGAPPAEAAPEPHALALLALGAAGLFVRRK